MHPGLYIPLAAVPTGRSIVLRQIHAGRGLTSRLAAMGFVPGVIMTVERNDGAGPVLVGLKGGRVMLGRGMANKIAVES